MSSNQGELKNTTYEAFVGVLSILSIANILLIYITASDTVDEVINIMNIFLSAIFIGDFAYRMVTASSRPRYFFREFGWADLAASIPLPQFKILRIFRVFRAYRLGKEYGVGPMIRNFWRERASSALFAVVLFILLLLQFGSMAMVWVEARSDESNITSGSDAVWWAYVTITTVGYGDQFPVTNAGRAIGVLVMTGGVALFGVMTGFLANTFLSPAKPEEEKAAAVIPGNAKSMLAGLRQMVDDQEATTNRLRQRIAEIEALM